MWTQDTVKVDNFVCENFRILILMLKCSHCRNIYVYTITNIVFVWYFCVWKFLRIYSRCKIGEHFYTTTLFSFSIYNVDLDSDMICRPILTYDFPFSTVGTLQPRTHLVQTRLMVKTITPGDRPAVQPCRRPWWQPQPVPRRRPRRQPPQAWWCKSSKINIISTCKLWMANMHKICR